ncbi:MAG: hypothetical protein ACP5UH_01500 [Candidatus Micrarchaeia archaeon]
MHKLVRELFRKEMKQGAGASMRAAIGAIALSEGLISSNLYSVAILGIVITSLIMPALIGRRTWRHNRHGSRFQPKAFPAALIQKQFCFNDMSKLCS